MMATCKEDRQWSGKKMEFGEGLKTLECLRGRLLAERQASRSAKEEADCMGGKLIELENQIRKETELRNKAERRLKLLIKKLESLNIASVTSEISTLSEISTSSSATKEAGDKESRSENPGEEVPNISTDKQRDEKKPNQNALDRAKSNPNSKSSNNSSTDSRLRKDQSFSEEVNEREKEDYIDNLQESVLPGAAPAAKPETGAMKTKATDVHDALKHIRGNVQSSFEKRNHMKAIMSM